MSVPEQKPGVGWSTNRSPAQSCCVSASVRARRRTSVGSLASTAPFVTSVTIDDRASVVRFGSGWSLGSVRSSMP